MDNLLSVFFSLGHFLIGFYFVFFGVWNVYHWSPTLQVMNAKGIPHPWLVLPIGIAWQVIAGCLIIFGIYVKLAALSLIFFTLFSICLFHPFWNFTAELRRLHFTIFMTSLTMTLGGLCVLMYG